MKVLLLVEPIKAALAHFSALRALPSVKNFVVARLLLAMQVMKP